MTIAGTSGVTKSVIKEVDSGDGGEDTTNDKLAEKFKKLYIKCELVL